MELLRSLLAITAQPNSNGGTVDVLANVTGGINITGTKTLIVHMDNVTTDNAFTMGTQVGELHLSKVKNASGAINAAVVALTRIFSSECEFRYLCN